MNIDGLKRQHQEIGQLINVIESYLIQDVVAEAFDISLKIATLAGKLSIHLKSEDNYLYPTLMAILCYNDLNKSLLNRVSFIIRTRWYH